jgi:hypothetical protein
MTETTTSSVFLLCNSTSFEDFFSLAEREHWMLVQQHDGDGEVTGFSQARIAPDGQTEIHYVKEPSLGGIRFLVLRGPGAGEAAEAIGRDLEVRTSINVVRIARQAQTDDEKRTSALELGVIFKEADPRALEILRSYYDGGSEPVRRRVIAALTYRGWPQGIEMLEYISRVDASPALRRLAQEMVEMWKSRA